MQQDDELKLKAAFAAFLLETGDRFAAAFKLYGAEKDRGEALRIAFAWEKDPAVIIEMERLKQNQPNKNIPTKEQVIEQLWNMAQNEKVYAKDRSTAAFMVAKMLKYVDSDDTESKRMPTQPVYQIVKE